MWNKFKKRSYQPEMLDEIDIPRLLLFKNLAELDILNRLPGGHSLTLWGIKQLLTTKNRVYHITDLGCGSGGTLKYMAAWARRNNYTIKFTGVDMNPVMIDYLNEHCKIYPEITGVVSTYQDYLKKDNDADILICSLFCHHLTNEQLYELFVTCKRYKNLSIVINDIKRNALAYYTTWLFTRLFGASELAKNDGPVSVLKAFTKCELADLMRRANVKHTIRSHWAFRYLVIGKL